MAEERVTHGGVKEYWGQSLSLRPGPRALHLIWSLYQGGLIFLWSLTPCIGLHKSMVRVPQPHLMAKAILGNLLADDAGWGRV